jgi:predicted RNA methylase
LLGQQKSDLIISININLSTPKVGSYKTDEVTNTMEVYIENIKYRTSKKNIGDLTITYLSASKKIISDTFSFNPVN